MVCVESRQSLRSSMIKSHSIPEYKHSRIGLSMPASLTEKMPLQSCSKSNRTRASSLTSISRPPEFKVPVQPVPAKAPRTHRHVRGNDPSFLNPDQSPDPVINGGNTYAVSALLSSSTPLPIPNSQKMEFIHPQPSAPYLELAQEPLKSLPSPGCQSSSQTSASGVLTGRLPRQRNHLRGHNLDFAADLPSDSPLRSQVAEESQFC